jgi:hypothetical protein
MGSHIIYLILTQGGQRFFLNGHGTMSGTVDNISNTYFLKTYYLCFHFLARLLLSIK